MSKTTMKEITVLIQKKEVITVKSILTFLKEKYPGYTVKKFKMGRVSEKRIITFKVDNKYFKATLEKFAFNNIQIMNREKAVVDFIEERKEHKTNKLRSRGWGEVKTKRNDITPEDLEKFTAEGEYEKVLKETRPVPGSDIEIVKKAQSLLALSIENAINKDYKLAQENKYKAQESIDKLIRIASNPELKNTQKIEERIKAGSTAIKICLLYDELLSELIPIANNNKINNIVNIKAAIAFSEKIPKKKSNIPEEFSEGCKSINTRWLKIAFETVQTKLKKKEITAFYKLIGFIEANRNAA